MLYLSVQLHLQLAQQCAYARTGTLVPATASPPTPSPPPPCALDAWSTCGSGWTHNQGTPIRSFRLCGHRHASGHDRHLTWNWNGPGLVARSSRVYTTNSLFSYNTCRTCCSMPSIGGGSSTSTVPYNLRKWQTAPPAVLYCHRKQHLLLNLFYYNKCRASKQYVSDHYFRPSHTSICVYSMAAPLPILAHLPHITMRVSSQIPLCSSWPVGPKVFRPI